jgi:hypothetical protein
MDNTLPSSASDVLAVALTTRDSAGVIRVHLRTLQFVAAKAWRGLMREHPKRRILYAAPRKKLPGRRVFPPSKTS